MYKMRRLLPAVVLTLTFALSVSAGEIECGVAVPPPPPQAPVQATPTDEAASNDVILFVQTLLQSVLSVF